MLLSTPARKVMTFGLIGAAGCLLGWAVGEGFLWAVSSSQGSPDTAPSLAARPPLPDLPTPPRSVPTPPLPPAPDKPELAPAPAPKLPPPVKLDIAPTPPPPPELAERLKAAGAKTGDVQISLGWKNYNDLDLHCIDPNGDPINYLHRMSPSGGELDVDMNVTPTTDKPVENIYWPKGKAPKGKYKVYVHHYANHGKDKNKDPTEYQVSVLVGHTRKEYTGSITHPEKKLICEFEVAPFLLVSAPTEVVVNQEGSNRFRVRLAREAGIGEVKLKLNGDLAGLTAPEVTVPADRDEAQIEVKSGAAAKGGVRRLRLLAEGGGGTCEAPIALTVRAPPPTLRVSLPAEVSVKENDRNAFTLRLARDHFAGPVTVRLDGDLQGLRTEEKVVPAERDQIEVEVFAESKVQPGVRALRVIADGSAAKADVPLALTVVPLAPALRLAVPDEVRVPSKGSAPFRVRVGREDFTAPVTLKLAGDLAGLNDVEVTLAAGQNEAELTLTADTNAPDGPHELRLIAWGGPVNTEVPLSVVIEKASAAASAWSWRLILVIGLWTALLTIGLSLALIAGQNRYLGRPWLSGNQAVIVTLGALAAGLVAGGLGQMLLNLFTRLRIPPEIGFIVGWLLLGALVGRGVCFFIPNLNALHATLAGAAGALLGALFFQGAAWLGGDVAGRLMGAALLGGAVGLMVALVEAAFRKAWLEIAYAPREVAAVNLGPEPVSLGGDGRACTILARGAAPIALRYWFRDGQVMCEDVAAGKASPVLSGHHRSVGALTVTVRTADDEDEPPPAPIPLPPAPVPHPVQQAPVMFATASDRCPRCGVKALGKPGQRFCIACGEYY
jgi:hypothetical protein